MESQLSERVKELTTRVFTIAGCPEETYQRFTRFCELNARNVRVKKDKNTGEIISQYEELIYHIGLRILLDIAEADGKSQMLFEKINSVESELSILKSSLNNKQEEKTVERKAPIGFGAKRSD